MNFTNKWKLKSETPKRIDKMDKTPAENSFVNSVKVNRDSEKTIPNSSVNIVNANCNPEKLKIRFNDLLDEVGASVSYDDERNPSLIFEPHLAGPDHDPQRWALALELESLFFDQEVLS